MNDGGEGIDKNMRGGVLFMDERIKIAAAIIVLSLVGAFAVSFLTSVPKEKYDELQKGCEQGRIDAGKLLEAEQAKARFAGEELRGCEDEKKGAEGLIEAKNTEIAELRKDSDALAQARERADLHEQQKLLLEYYLDAFGSGKVLNNPRMQKIEGQLAVIGDAGLTGLWLEVKGCQTLLGCQNAKGKFTGAINTRMSLYANETVEIVEQAQ